jgi:heme A synthase
MTDEDTRTRQRYAWAIRLFGSAQIAFFLCLLLCVLIIPNGLLANHGYCFYGEQEQTRFIYRLSFALTGLLTCVSALCMPNAAPFRVIRAVFLLLLPLFLGLVLTTSSYSRAISLLHVRIGTVLFMLQALLAAWLTFIGCRDRRNYTLFATLFFGGVMTLLSLYIIIPLLIEGQIIFQLAFGMLVIHSLCLLQMHIDDHPTAA